MRLRSSSYRVLLILAALFLSVPATLSCQTKLTISPQFDDRLSSRASFFPHKVPKRARVALVLSGGGARGIAQVGVLRALERHNIPIDFICGTSFGAIIGGLYASGYSVAELESLALHTDWDNILSLTDETSRTELFVDQKLAYDRSFLVVRFQGLTPVIPPAVSSGQRLTDFISDLALQALYHPHPSFDDLRISFRCVATDLISGRRIIIKDGSLWEALRAASTVPLLFSPVEKDSMQLIDGGLLSNIPVDAAKDENYDLVLAVNCTSGLRNSDEMKAPWQTADQIMGIMMQLPNELQLKNADMVITPRIGKHLASNFKGLDSLILEGERSAESRMSEIVSLYQKKSAELDRTEDLVYRNVRIEVRGEGVPDSLLRQLYRQDASGHLAVREVTESLRSLYDVGEIKDACAEVTGDTNRTTIVYEVVRHPVVRSAQIEGCSVVPCDLLQEKLLPLVGLPFNSKGGEEALREIVREYRARGYSLARIESAAFDDSTGTLHVVMNEGVIQGITVQGGLRTRDEFVLQDFPLQAGQVFQIDKAKLGMNSISGTKLFEYVYLEVMYVRGEPFLTIRLKERPSQLVRFGFHADNEREVQGSLDIRDENFRGSGMELGLTFLGGGRNQDALLEYKARRLFGTSLSFNVGAFYGARNSHLYADAPQSRPDHWGRIRVGEYRNVRYGGRLAFGNQLERLGSATIEFSLQQIRVTSLSNAEYLEERYRLAIARFGTVIDTKDRYPFPTSGTGMDISLEFALAVFGGEIGYNALRFSYEWFTTWGGGSHTLHPRFTLGFADRTMPFAQQFRVGGRESFFGLHEDDRYGRQLLLVNLEYRYLLPVRLVFDSYLQTHLDAVALSSVPEEIKFNTLRYGAGVELALETPIGPAIFGIGKGFYFSKDLPENPIQEGPTLFYFMIGYQL
jgi:NTE family protein